MIFSRLLALFIIIPVIELAIFIQLKELIDLPYTLLLIVATAFIGAALTKQQGLATLAKFQEKTTQGQLPGKELAAGILILVAVIGAIALYGMSQ